MIVTIQAVPKRMSWVSYLKSQIPEAIVHVDGEYKGSVYTFVDMLKYQFDDYRVHLQDDVFLCKGFNEYLPELIKILKEKNIDFLLLEPYNKKKIH